MVLGSVRFGFRASKIKTRTLHALLDDWGHDLGGDPEPARGQGGAREDGDQALHVANLRARKAGGYLGQG